MNRNGSNVWFIRKHGTELYRDSQVQHSEFEIPYSFMVHIPRNSSILVKTEPKAGAIEQGDRYLCWEVWDF